MKPLPETFVKAGFNYEQVKRVGQVAIYKQTRIGQPKNVHFEVGVINQNPERTIHGKLYEAGESWPHSEQWGKTGFTYQDLSGASLRMALLVTSENKTPKTGLPST